MTIAADHPVQAAGGPTASYLHGLNGPQREAVETVNGPLLVLAGAGTGKTRVLTTRIAHILNTRQAWPGQILAVTFTNKAAQEMKDRVQRLLGQPLDGLWIGTFHSVAARILRRHAEGAGLQPDFTILDRDDQIRLLKKILEDRNIDLQTCPPRLALSVIQRFKDRGLTPDRVRDEDAGRIAEGQICEIYQQYQGQLLALNAADFGDLLLHCLTIFAARAEILSAFQDRFHYILVDEYQDTNLAQYMWLRLLAMGRENICCVGDDDQAIYSWRGAEVGNILRFDQDFPDARVIRLEENYRSTGAILAVASQIVANNHTRLGKTLWTGQKSGRPVEVHRFLKAEEEARFIVSEIEGLQRGGVSLDGVAILVRASFQMRELEERLVHTGVPYRIVGGLRFYESREIRDAVAYFRCVVQPNDSLAFERIMNVPRRGLGPAALRTLYQYAGTEEVSLGEAALQLCETDELRPQARTSLRLLLQNLQNWRDRLEFEDGAVVALTILKESGYISMWQTSKEPDAQGRLENLYELVSAVAEFESLPGFLEHISLSFDRDEGAAGEAVCMMTLHAAKGLEFDHVFLPGWEENLFPNARALEEQGFQAEEEERRLAYVGLTRARLRIWISHADFRMVRGRTMFNGRSRFIREIEGKHVEVRDHSYREAGYGADRAFGERRGPGFRRMRDTGNSVDQSAAGPARSPGPSINTGDRIFHQKFGYGTVSSIDGDKLSVNFEKAGRKTIMRAFVRPA